MTCPTAPMPLAEIANHHRMFLPVVDLSLAVVWTAHLDLRGTLRTRVVTETQARAQRQTTPESYLDLSLAYFRTGRYRDCINAARDALRLRPNYPEAYNNIAAGYNALGLWDDGIRSAEQAVRLKPDYQLARNNREHARRQKASPPTGER